MPLHLPTRPPSQHRLAFVCDVPDSPSAVLSHSARHTLATTLAANGLALDEALLASVWPSPAVLAGKLDWFAAAVQRSIMALLSALVDFRPNLIVLLGNDPKSPSHAALHLFKSGNVAPPTTKGGKVKWEWATGLWRGSLFLSNDALWNNDNNSAPVLASDSMTTTTAAPPAPTECIRPQQRLLTAARGDVGTGFSAGDAFSCATSPVMEATRQRMAATVAEGTAHKGDKCKCAETTSKSAQQGDSRKDGTNFEDSDDQPSPNAHFPSCATINPLANACDARPYATEARIYGGDYATEVEKADHVQEQREQAEHDVKLNRQVQDGERPSTLWQPTNVYGPVVQAGLVDELVAPVSADNPSASSESERGTRQVLADQFAVGLGGVGETQSQQLAAVSPPQRIGSDTAGSNPASTATLASEVRECLTPTESCKGPGLSLATTLAVAPLATTTYANGTLPSSLTGSLTGENPAVGNHFAAVSLDATATHPHAPGPLRVPGTSPAAPVDPSTLPVPSAAQTASGDRAQGNLPGAVPLGEAIVARHGDGGVTPSAEAAGASTTAALADGRCFSPPDCGASIPHALASASPCSGSGGVVKPRRFKCMATWHPAFVNRAWSHYLTELRCDLRRAREEGGNAALALDDCLIEFGPAAV